MSRDGTRKTISKRWTLVMLVSAVQLVCLVIGTFLLSGWLGNGIEVALRKQVLADNQQMSAQVADLISRLEISAIGKGSSDWERLQDVVESIELPNRGFLCVIDSGSGQLLCHPKLRDNPAMSEMIVGNTRLQGALGRDRSLIDILSRANTTTSGWAEMPDGTHLIGATTLPDLGITVLAHQHDSGVASAVSTLITPLRSIALGLALGMVAITAGLSTLIIIRYESHLTRVNEALEDEVTRRSRSLMRTRDAVIFGLAKLAESRDDDTGQHLERIREYTGLLAQRLIMQRNDLDRPTAEMIVVTSSLHDIGKVGVPDAILLKPGKLTPEEHKIVQKHTNIGGDCLMAIKKRLGEDDFLSIACEIAFSHHEKWDGSGYPFGLAGEDIPLSGRIVALADVYDALTSRRVYKDAMTHDQARTLIIDSSGTHFDPQIVDAFLDCEDEFERVSSRGQTTQRLEAAA